MFSHHSGKKPYSGTGSAWYCQVTAASGITTAVYSQLNSVNLCQIQRSPDKAENGRLFQTFFNLPLIKFTNNTATQAGAQKYKTLVLNQRPVPGNLFYVNMWPAKTFIFWKKLGIRFLIMNML